VFDWELFTIPRAFEGIHEIRQTNAAESWSRLIPRPQITMFGQDVGDIALSYGFWAPANINQEGTPLVGGVFLSMENWSLAKDILCYVNSDIILFQDFVDALEKVTKEFDQFLMVGQRWDIDINYRINFDTVWDLDLLIDLESRGSLHQPGGSDYFAFRKGLFKEFPPYAVGRVRWDNWVISSVVARGIPVVDVSLVTTVVHQDVRTIHEAETEEERLYVALYNRTKGRVAGNITDSDWILDDDGFHRR